MSGSNRLPLATTMLTYKTNKLSNKNKYPTDETKTKRCVYAPDSSCEPKKVRSLKMSRLFQGVPVSSHHPVLTFNSQVCRSVSAITRTESDAAFRARSQAPLSELRHLRVHSCAVADILRWPNSKPVVNFFV